MTQKYPIKAHFGFAGIPVECADILWLDGYLNMSWMRRGEAIPAQHLGISSSS